MALNTTSFVLKASSGYPYHLAAKRYARPSATDDLTAVTLVVTHATGMHKEYWEPILQRILTEPNIKVREAWAIDAPNHGEAAVLNEKLLLTDWLDEFPSSDYGVAIGRFLSEGVGGVNFKTHRLVALGHSLGAVAMIWLQQSSHVVKFESMILVEPMLDPTGRELQLSAGSFFPSAYQRRDVWPSRDAALQDFKSNKGYKAWDPRMIELYAQYALRPHPAALYEVGAFGGVTLACSRLHEAACYRGGYPFTISMVPALVLISRQVAVSAIFGDLEDSVNLSNKETLADEEKSGVHFATVHWVNGAGHLAPQNNPNGVADAVIDVLKVAPLPPLAALAASMSRHPF